MRHARHLQRLAVAAAVLPAPARAQPAPTPAPATTTRPTRAALTSWAPDGGDAEIPAGLNPALTPDTVEVDDGWNAPVFASGALVFAGSFGGAVMVGATSDHVGADQLYLPIAGPWLALGKWGDCPLEKLTCTNDTTDKVLLVTDGLFQIAGMLTMLDGLIEPSHHTVVVHHATTALHVVPIRNGLAIAGGF